MTLDTVHEEICVGHSKSDVEEDPVNVLLSLLFVVFDPSDDGLEDKLFHFDVESIFLDDLQQLIDRQR